MSSLTDGHATMLRSAVSSGRQVVHQARRIFVGREVSSAGAVASVGNLPVVCEIFRAGLRGDVRFRVSAGLAKLNKSGAV